MTPRTIFAASHSYKKSRNGRKISIILRNLSKKKVAQITQSSLCICKDSKWLSCWRDTFFFFLVCKSITNIFLHGQMLFFSAHGLNWLIFEIINYMSEECEVVSFEPTLLLKNLRVKQRGDFEVIHEWSFLKCVLQTCDLRFCMAMRMVMLIRSDLVVRIWSSTITPKAQRCAHKTFDLWHNFKGIFQFVWCGVERREE